jgi:hypothetical protein
MKKEFGTTQPKSLEDKIDNLARAMAAGFSSLQVEINSIKVVMATKADILALHDKFPSNQNFDALTVRVSKLEAKSKR